MSLSVSQWCVINRFPHIFGQKWISDISGLGDTHISRRIHLKTTLITIYFIMALHFYVADVKGWWFQVKVIDFIDTTIYFYYNSSCIYKKWIIKVTDCKKTYFNREHWRYSWIRTKPGNGDVSNLPAALSLYKKTALFQVWLSSAWQKTSWWKQRNIYLKGSDTVVGGGLG